MKEANWRVERFDTQTGEVVGSEPLRRLVAKVPARKMPWRLAIGENLSRFMNESFKALVRENSPLDRRECVIAPNGVRLMPSAAAVLMRSRSRNAR